MIAAQLNIDEAPVVYAVDKIIKPHLENLRDKSGNKVFDNVKYGIDFPVKTPTDARPLTCCIWMDHNTPVMESTPMYVGGVKQLVSLYINFYDQSGGKINVNAVRTNVCRYILKSLEGADLSTDAPKGLPQYIGMEFDYDSLKVDHTTPFKRINDYLMAEPPWYTSRIDFSITCDNNLLPVLLNPQP